MSAPFEEAPRRAKDLLPPPAPAWPPAKISRRGLIALVSVVSILILLAMLLFNALFRPLYTATTSDGVGQAVPVGWHRYADPGGFFSVALPNGWTVQRDTGTTTMGDAQGSVTVQDVMDVFGGPPRGQKTITVWIHVTPIVNDLERQMACPAGHSAHDNTTVAGLPATYDPVFGWLVDTNNASFQISYEYPNWKGDISIPANAPTATPMPPGFYEQGQQEMQTIIASFTPTPATPLACK